MAVLYKGLADFRLASTPKAPYLEFCIERVAEGRLTPHLWQLVPGEQVTLRTKTKGKLSLDAASQYHLMVASVTGVGAPPRAPAPRCSCRCGP